MIGLGSRQFVKSRWWWLAVAVVGIAGLTFLYFVNPADISGFPRCPFLVLTGYQCPGCGTLRGIHSLLNLRFHEAWNYNPAMVVAIPVIAGLVFSARFRRSVIVSRTILVATLCYWILRNLW